MKQRTRMLQQKIAGRFEPAWSICMAIAGSLSLSLLAGPQPALPRTNAVAEQASGTAARRLEAPVGDGKPLFEQFCAACHGLSGAGQEPLAPPLTNSNWVLGPESRLIRITLQGVEGTIHVSGTTYEPPAVLFQMPPLAVLEDAQIASILSFIRHEWGKGASPVSPAQVAKIRDETAKREAPWTEEELSQIK